MPTYPYAAALGVVFGVITLITADGWDKLRVLVWVVLVPLWLKQWWSYRIARRAEAENIA